MKKMPPKRKHQPTQKEEDGPTPAKRPAPRPKSPIEGMPVNLTISYSGLFISQFYLFTSLPWFIFNNKRF